jgi:hypothetical protein
MAMGEFTHDRSVQIADRANSVLITWEFQHQPGISPGRILAFHAVKDHPYRLRTQSIG